MQVSGDTLLRLLRRELLPLLDTPRVFVSVVASVEGLPPGASPHNPDGDWVVLVRAELVSDPVVPPEGHS